MAYVLDTSIIIDGRIVDLIDKGKVKGDIYIHAATIAELEHQANLNKEVGFTGFSVISELRKREAEGKIRVLVTGKRPTLQQIIGAKKTGEIDAIIRELAKNLNAILVTADRVQHLAAEAEGIPTIYLKAREVFKPLTFEQFFDEFTMSVHLRENCPVVRKRGTPGNWKLEKMDVVLSTQDMRRIGEEIIEATKRNINYYVEIDKLGATVIQMGDYRIVIAKPPFSDGFEITVVRPIKKLTLQDYKLDKKLLSRLDGEAEGILIAGPPGSGKTTFATALAEYYASKGKIVKTMEDPRDMKLIDEITQYTRLEGSYEYTKDIILLVRPDYVFFDEVRKTEEFLIYTDLRMAGVGMIGVVHAKKAIDAIQRFIGKIELGLIPQVIDTIILIDAGRIKEVYSLEHTIKVPTGMREADLARPVVEVRDFYSGKLEYEIYKFGEETVVLPIRKKNPRVEAIEKVLRNLLSTFSINEENGVLVIYVPRQEIAKLYRRYKKRFERLERKFGPIEVREM